MGRVAVRWASEELSQALAELTSQQARGVIRIVQAELAGEPISSLFDNPDQICTSTTYYGSGQSSGWRHKPLFNRAVELARRDYRQWLLEQSTGEALSILASTAPEAARALRQQIVGDRAAVIALTVALKAKDAGVRKEAALRLGETGLPAVVASLATALKREKAPEVREVMVAALGSVAGWRDGDRRAAATGVLDRADVRTATKQAFSVNEDEFLAPLAGLSDEELDQVIENLESVGSDKVSTQK